MKKTTFYILSILLLCYGCVAMPVIEQPRRAELPSQNLNEEQVLRMADAFAKQNREADNKSFTLQNYPYRKAWYNQEEKYWWVNYDKEGHHVRDGHFAVRIDDVTGKMLYFGAP